MNVEQYLAQGKRLYDSGQRTDGCTFIGWLIHLFYGAKFDNACWSHDFGRQELIKFESQSENDNMFKDALKHLGAPRPLRFVMYFFTKLQGFFKDNFNMSLNAFLGFIFFLCMVVFIFYMASKQDAHAATGTVSIDWINPTGRESCEVWEGNTCKVHTPLDISEILSFKLYYVDPVQGIIESQNFINWGVKPDGISTMFWWESNDEPLCWYLTTIDTAFRESLYSRRFCLQDYPQAPKIVCQ